ncbi:hypothetical protein L1887_01438 [Cichorium endivia]|nr:hypothetical protein L1887_01438 [Cichorium endivia]
MGVVRNESMFPRFSMLGAIVNLLFRPTLMLLRGNPWEEIKKRSRNLSRVIGSGGFSTVYLARLPDSGLTAVKIQLACTERLAQIHDQELQILLRLKHPNIVNFLGHCDNKEEERVLLFEYVSKGIAPQKQMCLRFLSFDFCWLESGITWTKPNCKNSTVSSIDLSNIDLSMDFGLVSSSLLTLPSLESFVAKNCNLTGTVSWRSRSQCSKVLTSVDLSVNKIAGSVSDISSLSACPKLKLLNFSRNLMEFTGGSKPIWLSLQVIDLSFNQISGPEVIPWILSDGCGELVEFNVSSNNISGTVPRA